MQINIYYVRCQIKDTRAVIAISQKLLLFTVHRKTQFYYLFIRKGDLKL